MTLQQALRDLSLAYRITYGREPTPTEVACFKNRYGFRLPDEEEKRWREQVAPAEVPWE